MVDDLDFLVPDHAKLSEEDRELAELRKEWLGFCGDVARWVLKHGRCSPAQAKVLRSPVKKRKKYNKRYGRNSVAKYYDGPTYCDQEFTHDRYDGYEQYAGADWW